MGGLDGKTINIISIILLIAFVYPIIMGFIFKVKSKSLITTLKGILTSIAIVCSIILTTTVVRDVVTLDKYGLMEYISSEISPTFALLITKSKLFTGVILLIVFLVIYQLLKLIIELVSRFMLYPVSNAIDDVIRDKDRWTKSLLGSLFQIPKAICYMIILTALLSYANLFLNDTKLNAKLNDSKIYSYINKNIIKPVTESEIAKSLPNLVENSFRMVDEQNNSLNSAEDSENGYLQGIIFYNGVTLDQGVKSNEVINNAALSITSKYNNDYDRAKALYKWVGNTIIYDDDKAVKVMENQLPTGITSGAINTFNTKTGVCFDYACLYVAMCRANNIPVRLIVGEGFNGQSWISHSWNEVYIAEKDEWINADPTFYNAGNFFDSVGFNMDHRNRKIAGEWK